ncbi:MAG TPA: hypothetical protein DD727_05065 [Clostridiales bacterium]|nr:hypothetical protein [Clostridiales bacterium]
MPPVRCLQSDAPRPPELTLACFCIILTPGIKHVHVRRYDMIKIITRITLISTLAVLLSVLFACGSTSKDVGSADAIAREIEQAVLFERLTDMPADNLENYGVNATKLASYVIRLPAAVGAIVDELIVLEFRDAGEAAGATAGFQKYMEQRLSFIKTYNAQLYAIASRYVLKTNGKYLLFVINKESEKAEAAFDKLFK